VLFKLLFLLLLLFKQLISGGDWDNLDDAVSNTIVPFRVSDVVGGSCCGGVDGTEDVLDEFVDLWAFCCNFGELDVTGPLFVVVVLTKRFITQMKWMAINVFIYEMKRLK
jgi:hypothetical protein